jgi:hypothetical protein
MNRTSIRSIVLIVFCFGIVILLCSGLMGAKINDKKDIQIGLELICGKKLPQILTKASDGDEKDKYILGTTKNLSGRMVWIDIEIFSPNNHNLKVPSVKISLLPPTPQKEIYFLVYAGRPIMNTTDQKAELQYKITDIKVK